MGAGKAAGELRKYRAELHVHTVLSPCADIEMIPPLIVSEALDHRLDIVAITDHNASANVPAVQQAAAGSRLTVIPGIELQTAEEVHLLCLFDCWEDLQHFQKKVDQALPERENDPEFFGEQFVVDKTGDFLYREKRLLLNSCRLDYASAVQLAHKFGGLAIPAHIDRRAFGLLANLGFLPAEPKIDAVEISRHTTREAMLAQHPEIAGIPMLQGGDVHYLPDFLGANQFTLAAPTLAEIKMALENVNGRQHEIVTSAVDNLHPDV